MRKRYEVGGLNVTKGVMEKAQEAGVGAEEIARITEFCEECYPALKRLKIVREEGDREDDYRLALIKDYESKLHQARSDFARNLYKNDIKELKKSIECDKKITDLFQWLVDMLPNLQRVVLIRLYREDRPWRVVYDDNGELLTQGAVEFGKNNGLVSMAVEISKRNMWGDIVVPQGGEGHN